MKSKFLILILLCIIFFPVKAEETQEEIQIINYKDSGEICNAIKDGNIKI